MKLNTRSKSGEASEEKEQKPKKKRGGCLTFFIALMLGAALALWALNYLDSMQISAPAITSSLLKEELQYVRDLVTVEYRYTNADKAEFPGHTIFGQSVPFTGKSFIVSYDGVIKYGVDLGAVDVRVNDVTRTVTVTVPPSKLVSHEMPEASFKALDEKNGLFNRIHIDDVTEFRRTQKAAMEAKAVQLGLPRQAQERSGAAIEALLKTVPGMEDYTLKIQYD